MKVEETEEEEGSRKGGARKDDDDEGAPSGGSEGGQRARSVETCCRTNSIGLGRKGHNVQHSGQVMMPT